MTLRTRALYATSALLYSGPLYAGLAGFGFETAPAFAALFVVWLALVRPGDWPRTREALRRPRALAWPALLVGVQALLAGFCLAVGRGIGAMADLALPVPLVATLALSAAGIAAAWGLRRGRTGTPARVPGAAFGIGAGILDVAAPGDAAEGGFAAAAAFTLIDLARQDAPPERTEPLLTRIENAGAALSVLEALIEAPGRDAARAQVRLALRPAVAAGLASGLAGPAHAGHGATGRGLVGATVARAVESRDPGLIRETVAAAGPILARHPGLSPEFPQPARLRALADRMADEAPAAAEALRRLAGALDTAVAA